MTETELRERYGKINNNNSQPTQKYDEIIEQMAAQINDPGNVNDVKIRSGPVEEQTRYINIIKSMDRRDINNLIIGFLLGNGQVIYSAPRIRPSPKLSVMKQVG